MYFDLIQNLIIIAHKVHDPLQSLVVSILQDSNCLEFLQSIFHGELSHSLPIKFKIS